MRTLDALDTVELEPPSPPARSAQRSKRKVWTFVALCMAALAVSVAYVVRAAHRDRTDAAEVRAAPVPVANLEEIDGRPRVMFQSTAASAKRGNLAMAALASPDGARALVDLGCVRVDYAADLGVCLTPGGNLMSRGKALVFDAAYQVLYSLRISGLPSRVRVSPDGRWAATTAFVEGHSYADESFSTETLLLDLHHGKVVENLESFEVFRNGRRFREIDFNFWGVTFARDSNRFYATLGTGNHRYLVEGSLRAKQMKVLRDDVECPSLSPDNTRVAFKRRVSNSPGAVRWRLSVLDLATLKETAVAETRNLDDQAAWLDDQRLLYGLRPTPDSAHADTWVVPADGTGTPRLFVPQAWSPVVVRGP